MGWYFFLHNNVLIVKTNHHLIILTCVNSSIHTHNKRNLPINKREKGKEKKTNQGVTYFLKK